MMIILLLLSLLILCNSNHHRHRDTGDTIHFDDARIGVRVYHYILRQWGDSVMGTTTNTTTITTTITTTNTTTYPNNNYF